MDNRFQWYGQAVKIWKHLNYTKSEKGELEPKTSKLGLSVLTVSQQFSISQR